jgi:hypothetical protein
MNKVFILNKRKFGGAFGDAGGRNASNATMLRHTPNNRSGAFS